MNERLTNLNFVAFEISQNKQALFFNCHSKLLQKMLSSFWACFVLIVILIVQVQGHNNQILIIGKLQSLAASEHNFMANVSVSYDGFRPDFFHRNVTPFLSELRIKNTRAKYLRNVYPTKTFPNHHTILTGVHPEDHGVISNNLYDFGLAKPLNYSEELFLYPSIFKPVWLLNQLNYGHSGCMMWPGTDFAYDGVNCTYRRSFDPTPNFTDYIDEMFEWINDMERPANLLLFHVHEPDSHAHAYGPDHPKVNEVLAKLDNVTKYLHQRIQHSRLKNRINVVCISDHGMDNFQEENVIDLSKFVDAKTAQFYSTSPNIRPC